MSSRKKNKDTQTAAAYTGKAAADEHVNRTKVERNRKHEVVLKCNAHSTRQALILAWTNPSQNRAPLLPLVALVLGNTLGLMLVRIMVPFWVNLHRPWHTVVIYGESPGREGRPNG